MRKIFASAVIVLVVAGLGYQAYRLNDQRLELQTRAADVEEKVNALALESKQLINDLEYYSDATNLEKMTRTLDNFRAPDEKLFIIVPATEPETQP